MDDEHIFNALIGLWLKFTDLEQPKLAELAYAAALKLMPQRKI
jgi:hypothetical protein